MNLRDLRLRTRALFAPRRIERELDDELSFHIERETQKLMAEGMTGAEARAQALARFGPVPLSADRCRDARGTAFVDHTVRDIVSALRAFRRAPLVAFTIVSTVALGLSLVTVAFTLLNALLFRVDRVPDVHEMFAVERPRTSDGERERFTRTQFDALRRETNVFTDAYAIVSDIDSRLDGRRMSGTFVTGNVFQVLGVNAAIGRALTPEDDEPSAERPVMVLSHRGWDRLFARDPAILGRDLLVNGVTFDIVGVMPEGFRGLAVGAPDDYWAPLSMLGQVSPIHGGRQATVGLDIIGRLKPGLSRQTAQAGLAVWAAGQLIASPIERGASNITLVPRRGTVEQPREAVLVTAPLFFAFGLILLIGCANVTNLLLARAVVRQREIGIRLSLGATRRRIVRQLLTESLLLALVAAAVGFAISRVALEAIIKAVTASWPPEIGDIRLVVPDADWRVALFLIIAAAVSTIVFGLAPALQATRIEPIRTLRGEVVPLISDARPGRARNLLIGVQVSASALLLIAAAVFLRSAFAAAVFDPGMRISDILIVEIANEPTRTAIVQAVTAEPSVAAVAVSWPALVAPPRAAFAEAAGAKATVAYKFVSPEYFSVLDIAVVRGRAFTPDERSSKLSVAIVSAATALALWPNADALGQVVRLDPDPKSETQGVDEPLLANVHRGRGRPGRRRISDRTLQGSRRLRADKRHDAQDLARRARPRRSRTGTADASQSLDQPRSQHRPGGGHAVGDQGGNLLVAACVLVDGRPWRAGPGADAVGPVQRAVVPRRAAHQGNRRADGARCDHARCHPVGPVAVDPPRRRGPLHRRRCSRRIGRVAAGHAGRRHHWPDRSRPRSGRLRGESAHHHRSLPGGRLNSGHSRRSPRPDAGASPGIGTDQAYAARLSASS
jgi:putative ABC transport system permease protein